MFYRPGLDQHGLPHNPFKALVSPRPIAWVSTLDAQGRANLAPFSYFCAVADAPPVLMFAPMGRKNPEDPMAKDTLRNILATKEFVVHIVPKALMDAMNATSGAYPSDVDEFEAAGLEKAPSQVVAPPRVAASPVAMECKLITRVELPTISDDQINGVVFGEVVGVHIADEAVKDGRVDVLSYNPIARLGYMDYTAVEEVFALNRPKISA